MTRTRFGPGTVAPTHRHTGPVYAFTIAGSWKYADGNLARVLDAGTVRDGYFLLCDAQGYSRPNIIGT